MQENSLNGFSYSLQKIEIVLKIVRERMTSFLTKNERDRFKKVSAK